MSATRLPPSARPLPKVFEATYGLIEEEFSDNDVG